MKTFDHDCENQKDDIEFGEFEYLGGTSGGCDTLCLSTIVKSKFIESGKTIVVKIIEKTKKQAKAEMNFMRKVNLLLCPYLMRYICYHFSNGHVYFIMDYFEEGNLRSFLSRKAGQCFEEKEIKRMIAELIVGMFALHVISKLVHGDIKSDNIIVSNSVPNIDLKITDFGSSSVVGNAETIVTVRGTDGYKAPEIRGKETDRLLYTLKSDVYSLGVVFYEIVHPSAEIPVHPVFNNDDLAVPEELKIIIKKMLSKKPEKRPSIEDLINAEYIADAIRDLPPETLPSVLAKKLKK